MTTRHAVVILVAAALLAGCGGGASGPDEAQQQDAAPVRTHPAATMTIPREIRAVLLGESLGEANFASGFEGPSLDTWYVYNQSR